MLVLNNISFEFGSRYLYQDTSWHIKPFEKIGLIGANGTGKSTLLRIIVGEYQLSGGEITKRKSKDSTHSGHENTSACFYFFTSCIARLMVMLCFVS